MRRKTNETEIEVSLEFLRDKRRIGIGCVIPRPYDRPWCSAGPGSAYVLRQKRHRGRLPPPYGGYGIVLGQMLREIAKEGGIARYGWCILPMDGSLARVALDFSGRGASYFSGSFPSEKCGDSTWNSWLNFSGALQGGRHHAPCRC